jgi:hypothetical protein
MARPTKRCIYCGNPAKSSEHIVARCLLEKPYPKNLLTAPACDSCNHSYAADEEYFEVVLAQIGTTPTLTRKIEAGGKVDRALSYSPRFDDFITSSLKVSEGRVYIETNLNRVNRVLLKIAAGLFYKRYSYPISLNDIQAVGAFPYNIEESRPNELIIESHSESFIPKRWNNYQRRVFRYQFVRAFGLEKRLFGIMDFHQTLWGVVSIPIPTRAERKKQTKDFGTPSLF